METAESTAGPLASQPILVELDGASWNEKMDAIERWLHNTLMIQAGFRRLAEDVRDKLHEPHFRDFVSEIADTAARHEHVAQSLYESIGRQPPRLPRWSGKLLAPLRETWADVIGAAGGAAPPFRDLQQLMMANMNSTSAFATAEQLGLAMGIRELARAAFQVVAEKHPHHMLLQEITLESAATAILYHKELAEPEQSSSLSPPHIGSGRLAGMALGGLVIGATLRMLLSSDKDAPT